jgi:hypothetical protein
VPITTTTVVSSNPFHGEVVKQTSQLIKKNGQENAANQILTS